MTRPSVVLVSFGTDYDGGAAISFMEAVSALRADDIPVVVVLPGPGQLLNDARALGAESHLMRLPRWADWCPHEGVYRYTRWTGVHAVALFEALRVLKRHSPSVVVTNTMTPPSFAIAARLLRVPHVWMVQEFGTLDYDLQFFLGYERTVRLIASLSRTVMCCSRAVEKSLLAVAPEMRTRVVRKAVRSAELPFRPRPPGPCAPSCSDAFARQRGSRSLSKRWRKHVVRAQTSSSRWLDREKRLGQRTQSSSLGGSRSRAT